MALSLGRTCIHTSDPSGITAHFVLRKGNTNYQTQTPGNYLLVNLIRRTLLTGEYAPPKPLFTRTRLSHILSYWTRISL